MIVDDHPGFRELASRMLSETGFDVVGVASSAAGALDLAVALRPDVVLLDVQLPDGLAFDLVGELMSLGALVVLTSSRSADDYGTRVGQSGAVGFVAKGELSGAALAEMLAGSKAV